MLTTEQAGFLGRWAMANGAAEALGLGTTFVLGHALASHLGDGSPRTVLGAAALAVLLGILLEGVVVGLAQGIVLRRRTLSVPLGSWVTATAVGAGLAWTVGMIPSTVTALADWVSPSGGAAEPGSLVTVGLATALGVITGPILGLAQWAVLRRRFPHALRWLWANGAAWAVGMPVLFLGMDLVPWEGSLLVRAASIYALCFGAGIAVGCVHGPVLLGITEHPAPESDPPSRPAFPRLA